MKIFAFFIVLLTILGQIVRFPFSGFSSLLLVDAAVLILFVLWAVQSLRQEKNMQNSFLFWPTMGFFAWALVSLIWNVGILHLSFSEGILSLAYYGRYMAYYALLFIFLGAIQEQSSAYKWKYLLFLSAGIIAVLGFLQLKYFPSFYDLRMHEQGWDPHIGRLLSTWFDPNLLGGYFAFILALMGGELWQQWKNQQRDKTFIIFSILFLIILAALGMTFSRSAYLAFLVAGFLFALIAERRLLIIGAIAIALLLSVSPRAQERVENAVVSAQALFTETEKTLDPTSRLRVQSWQVGWNIFREQPLTGVGFNTLSIVQKREWSFMTDSHASSGIDASLLTVMATTGIIGLFFYLWGWTVIAWKSLQNFFQTKNGFVLGYFCGLAGIFVHAVFVNTLFFNLFLPSLFLATALSLRSVKTT